MDENGVIKMRKMKVGDKVIAICWPDYETRCFEVKGKIIDTADGRYFVFKADELPQKPSPLHNCTRRFTENIGYYVRGYGRTDSVRIIPMEKVFNSLEEASL